MLRLINALGIGAAVVATAGCFSPVYPEGRPCSADGECPGDLICSPQSVCVTSPAEVDAAPADGPTNDAAKTCTRDEFSGSELGALWDPAAVGSTPTFALGGGLTITDAALLESVAMPPRSWIYDEDLDTGNQMHWNIFTGSGDFSITTAMSWNSADGELTQVALAGVDSAAKMKFRIGIVDASAVGPGAPRAHITTSLGAHSRYNFGANAVGSAVAGTVAWRVERRGSLFEVFADDTLVLSEPVDFELAAFAIMAIRFNDGVQTLPFGEVTIDFVEFCE